MAKIHREGLSVVWSGEKASDGSKCQPIVNIIFVHGLKGHPRATWEASSGVAQTDGTGGASKNHGFLSSIFGSKKKHGEIVPNESDQRTFWIEDFLPQGIPNARILTYGYNADVIGGLFQANNKNSISQHSRDLKAKLERDLDNEAPIIFVAHSLGGIIVKDALHRSKSARQRTKLIVFLGTPHRGSASAGWGQVASNLARLALQDSNKKILETLEVNNEILDNIQEAFLTVVYEDNLVVHSFQEARGISGMKGLHNKVVDDFSSKVNLSPAQETVETIDANHMQMTKYRSKDDSGYRAVSGVLKAFIGRPLKAQEVVPAEAPLPSFNAIHSDTAAISTAKVHFMVPFQRNKDLIGRREYIQSLETKLCVLNEYCRVALVGLGGIGKTRIALEYAYKHKNSDSVSVFWIHASTAGRMEKAYQEIAKEAGLGGAGDPKVDQLQLAKRWFESDHSGNWVMIIDNADDEDIFFGDHGDQSQRSSSASSKLARYFPRRSNGSILLTTRNRRVGVKFAGPKLTVVSGVITVPEMSVSESKRLLVDNLEDDNCDDNDVTELVETLENLPLALVQAAAFIEENSYSIGEYLQTYRGSDSSKIKLLSQDFEDDERDPDSKNPVAVTWTISFEHIRKNDPQAAELLSLMSVFDRQAIPKSLLSSDIEEVEPEKALGILKAFSLITLEQNLEAFSLHRLVFFSMRNWLSMNEELDLWTGKALVLLSTSFSTGTYENRETWMAYLPHAHAILSSDHLPSNENIAQATLRLKVSQALRQKGDYILAERMAQKSLDIREKALGKKHVHTLYALQNLGFMLRSQQKNKKAEEILRQTLRSFERMLGEKHPETLATVDELGAVLRYQGKYRAAKKLHRRALRAKEKALGEERPDTLASVNYLANVFNDQDNNEAAERLYRRALSAREKVLGKEHPDTLHSVNNLANVLNVQGNYEAAERLHRRALSAREKVLGKEHPDTLLSVWNLAYNSRKQDQYQTASSLYQRAVAGLERTLGSDHPHTQNCAKSYSIMLEHMRGSQMEHARAIGEDSRGAENDVP